jgi:RNA polymerase sigma-70 factor, ECF subfamily
LDQHCDSELVTAVCRGDRAAYTPLVRRHYKHVLLVCVGVLGNVHDAEDVAQDAMIKGFEKIRQLKEPDQFGHWVVKIARNLSINLLRRKDVAGRAVERVGHDSPLEDGSGDDLQAAVARLPLDLRLPLVMYYFDGRDVKTVAEKLNVSTSGVYTKLRMAIHELHQILTKPGETP